MEEDGRYRSPLLSFCLPDERPPEASSFRFDRLPPSRINWLLKRNLPRQFDAIAQDAGILHVHGLWETHSAITSRWANRNKRPYLVSAHGMLDPWALSQKRWKKQAYSLLIERRTLAEANCLRAITRNEAEQYRAFGLSNPIAVVPNGVTIPRAISAETFWQHFPHLRDKDIILFLGRLHPKKGLIPLCHAWRHIGHTCPYAHLVVAGPDCDDTEKQLREIVASHALGDSVTFAGPVYGELKWSTYAAARAFILPSFSEGFSVAVLEALGAGTPVILSEACYFPEAIEAGAGWLTGTAEVEIAESLATVLGTPDQDRQAMGTLGCRIVTEQYSWPKIASTLSDVNDWVLGGRKPPSIHLS